MFPSRQARFSTLMITAIAVLSYLLIRQLPAEKCELLHYSSYINEEGVIEFCGKEESIFFDLDTIHYPVEVTIHSAATIESGKVNPLQLEIVDYKKRPFRMDEIAVSHTEKIHLMVIDEQLEDYRHLHPKQAVGDGVYAFEFTPHREGLYRMYVDLISLKSGRRILASTSVMVEKGKDEAIADSDEFLFTSKIKSMLQLSYLDGPLTVNQKNVLQLSHSAGPSIHFETVMGAYAHLVVFYRGINGFAHLHPMNQVDDFNGKDFSNLTFSFTPDRVGTYKLWVQLKINGKELFIPYDLDVSK